MDQIETYMTLFANTKNQPIYVAVVLFALLIIFDLFKTFIKKTVEAIAEALVSNKKNDGNVPHYLTLLPTDTSGLKNRKSVLFLLDRSLQRKKKKRKVLISGLGGIGKTHLARGYFHRVKNKYKHVGWISYPENGCLEDALLICFTAFSSEIDKGARLIKIKDFLCNADRRTLLFIDNVTRTCYEDGFLQTLLNCDLSLVITSRLDKQSLNNIYSINLGFLSEKKCVNLFQSYYLEVHHKKLESRYESTVRKLVQLVSYHTLSVEMLAKAIEPGQTPADLLKNLNSDGFGFPSLEFGTEHSSQLDTIAEHYRKLFDLSELTEEHKRILQNFAALPNVIIPFEVKDWIGCSVNDLKCLVIHGWLTGHTEGYSMHDIIRLTILLERIPRAAFAHLIKYTLNPAFFPYSDSLDYFYYKSHIISEFYATTYWTLKNDTDEPLDAVIHAREDARISSSYTLNSLIASQVQQRKAMAVFDHSQAAILESGQPVVDVSPELVLNLYRNAYVAVVNKGFPDKAQYYDDLHRYFCYVYPNKDFSAWLQEEIRKYVQETESHGFYLEKLREISENVKI